jgi:hypothetical protein
LEEELFVAAAAAAAAAGVKDNDVPAAAAAVDGNDTTRDTNTTDNNKDADQNGVTKGLLQPSLLDESDVRTSTVGSPCEEVEDTVNAVQKQVVLPSSARVLITCSMCAWTVTAILLKLFFAIANIP